MEINQAAQTFLLFYFLIFFSLIGFAYFINNNKKTSKISLANAVQTSILFVGIFTLLVFGASYYFVLSDADPTKQPLKDALSISASFFGGFATLTAAYIASKLFNDWKEQHNLQIIALEAKNAFHLFHKQADQIYEFKCKIEDIENNKSEVKLSERRVAIDFQDTILQAYNIDKVTMGSFCYLTKGQKIYDLTMEYYNEIKETENILANKANQGFSDTRFLNKQSAPEFIKLFSSLEEKNNAILDELKTYIFVK
ncbi:hypothetical protein [Acinetobacter sp. P8-3-8]|uniref:hypothetical protein n=1 Tax=Acinetobacter sp. P8-3-8 TaxID=1029823 RepID=UPI00024869F6|nr:hypothetical protein [Acinetobacter sp. P8-3-8]